MVGVGDLLGDISESCVRASMYGTSFGVVVKKSEDCDGSLVV